MVRHRVLPLVALLFVPVVGLSASTASAQEAPECGEATQVVLHSNLAAVAFQASGGFGGSLQSVTYNGTQDIGSTDVKTLPLDISLDLDPGDVMIAGSVITYTPYNANDLKPLETITKNVSPTLSYDDSILLVHTTDFVRLESISVLLVVCGDSLPTAGGGSVGLVYVGAALLLVGVGAVMASRRRLAV